MPEHADKLLPPVLAAMSAVDDACAAHDRLTEQLARAMLEGVRLDEELRSIDFHDSVRLEAAAHAYADAVASVQRLAFRVKASRDSLDRARAGLLRARKEESHARTEMLRIELEIDAASIWDLVGRFEQQVRGRLEEHARIAEEMRFAAAAAGDSGATALEAATLAPALGTSGPDLWTALAGGVKQLYDKTGALPQLAAAAPPLPKAEEPAPRAVEAAQVLPPPPRETARPKVLPPLDRPASSVEISAALLQGLPAAVPTPSPAVLARAVTMPADLARTMTVPAGFGRRASDPPRQADAAARPADASRPAARPSPALTPLANRAEPAAAHAAFDFGRPDEARKAPAPLGSFALRPVPRKEPSTPAAPENNRGRLDKMLRNLASMVAPRRDPARRSRQK